MSGTAPHAHHVESRCDPDPVLRGGLLRGGPSAVAGQILLIGYLLGFAVSVADALAALTAHTGRGSSSGDAPSAALVGYLVLLALALLATA